MKFSPLLRYYLSNLLIALVTLVLDFMLTRSIQDFISNSKINWNWSQKSIEINRNFENFRLLFSTSKQHLFEKLFLIGKIKIYYLDQKVLGITTRWCSESAVLSSVFLVRLPHLSLTFSPNFIIIVWHL